MKLYIRNLSVPEVRHQKIVIIEYSYSQKSQANFQNFSNYYLTRKMMTK